MDSFFKVQSMNIASLNNFVRNLKKTGEANRNSAFLNARLSLLKEYWEKFCKYHDTIIENSTEEFLEHKYFKDDYYTRMEMTYISTQVVIFEELEKFNKPAQPTTANAVSATTASGPHAIALPKITIPVFNGDYLEWPAFQDLFVDLIHKNSSITDVQRLHYLKSSVTGEAAQLLKNVTITSGNYKLAWDALKGRYENKRIICNQYLQVLDSLPFVKRESADDLKKLLDRTVETVRALKQLGRSTDEWSDWLVFITVKRLDVVSRKEWEYSISDSMDFPQFDILQSFLERRVRTLEAVKISAANATLAITSSTNITNASRKFATNSSKVHHSVTQSSSNNCPDCGKRHFIAWCPTFRKKTVSQRRELIVQKNLCWNCMKSGHESSACPSDYTCRKCDQAHNTFLHFEGPSRDPGTNVDAAVQGPSRFQQVPSQATDQGATSLHVSEQHSTRMHVLLATALVTAWSNMGQPIQLRVLLDQGSQSSFISESAVQLLRLQKQRVLVPLSGIGSSDAGTIKSSVAIRISSRFNYNDEFHIHALVMKKLTGLIPGLLIPTTSWPHLAGIELADPSCLKPSNIDMILGADIYGQLLLNAVRKGPSGAPVAQNTLLGWILSGPLQAVPDVNEASVSCMHATLPDNIESVLRNFWENEECSVEIPLTEYDRACDQYFDETHVREPSGRYCVRLPLKPELNGMASLGESRILAITRLKQMERRFTSNETLKADYCDFMSEYVQLSHMQVIPSAEVYKSTNVCYLPHHAVTKVDSTTTKTRVVFNASQRTSNGFSLNDRLLKGPKLQRDLSSILLRWRKHAVAITGDIEKMFRQINIDQRDADLQRIVWRSSSQQDVRDYRLSTVTYGTVSAPYLAQKTIIQLAIDEEEAFPLAAAAVHTDFYVDDFVSGADNVTAALELQREAIALMQRGGFVLRKWSSNIPELLSHLPESHIEKSSSLDINEDGVIKTLGLYWQPECDTFGFRVNANPSSAVPTKRIVLSEIARLFDPLGWLSPVIIKAKILMQKLWLSGSGWDDFIPKHLELEWLQYKEELIQLKEIHISRWIGTYTYCPTMSLHGFSDASMAAYSAVVYLRVANESGEVRISLLASKTKVAPLKTVSLPRLELCGALLLTKLVNKVCKDIEFSNGNINLWCDSTIVLYWLRGEPSQWKTYVANRVALIQSTLRDARWRHVTSEQNPADCASRGLFPSQLSTHSLWWKGPTWLLQSETTWPTQTNFFINDQLSHAEAKTNIITCTAVPPYWELIYKFSTFRKLLRVTAFCFRFIKNSRLKERTQRTYTSLTAEELQAAKRFWILHTQSHEFQPELATLKRRTVIASNSKLIKLCPFIDEFGIIRVGGRVKYSSLDYSAKHPVVLSNANPLAPLVISQAHYDTLHGGIQMTLSHTRREFWLLNGRNQVRAYIHRCTICVRYRAATFKQLMGQLPPERLQPCRPFLHTGVDYAGPINIRVSKGRGQRAYKGYICVFVCFSSRAVHIELVSDYSAKTFIAAFKRFVSRRGLCSHIYSDCGTTFTGADRELNHNHQMSQLQTNVAEILANDGTVWHFIPPGAPHMGGLWEAAVKSIKHHLRRVIGESTLTFEEMTTLLTQIEACLNSRPLYAIHDDPDDYSALTPGHFLIGAPLTAVPGPSILDNSSIYNNWKLIDRMFQHFWSRWSVEYIHQLQQRPKWTKPMPSIKVGDLVLVKEDNLPPSKWLLGRVVETYPGKDGHTRVAAIRTSTCIKKRPVVKLVLLPMAPTSKDNTAGRTISL